MPREARVVIDGGTYHLVSRSNNGQRLFQDDRDYRQYLQLLSSALQIHRIKLFHFALLPTHVHLLVELSSAKGLSKAMQSLQLAYGHFYRRRYQYSGHLWRGRFKSRMIDPQQSLLACGRYIELNPVRAGLVKAPESYAWSSYRTYAEGIEHPLLIPHAPYESTGATPQERQRYYREFVLQGLQPRPQHLASSGLFFRPLPQPPKPLDDLFGPANAKRGRPRKLLASPEEGRVPLLKKAAVLFWFFGSLLAADAAFAQSSNGTYSLMQEFPVSGGGGTGGSGSNPMSMQMALGLPAGGGASSGTYALLGGAGTYLLTTQKPVTATVTISGTVDDSTCHVTVNGRSATLSGATFIATGVQLVAGPNTVTAVAADGAGNTRASSITIHVDLPTAQKTPRSTITVNGTTNDPSATITVSGVAAPVASGQFSAAVPVTNGYNTLTAIATDSAGNQGSASIKVFVAPPTQPPACPTVGTVGQPIPAVTTNSSVTIGGTKTAGTSIWINGQQIAGLDDATTWTTILSLVEGDNDFSVVAKDVAGASSAAATVTVVLDNLPPVVTLQVPSKTNFNPLILQGAVDDSLTAVMVNGLTAARAKRNFTVSVPLALGSNTLRLTATSPNGYVTQKTYAVTLGRMPTIQSLQPLDGTKLYTGRPATLQVTATDEEVDPIEYRWLVDGSVVTGWSASAASSAWIPPSAQAGLHRVGAEVRDGFGGSTLKEIDVFVVRPPVDHP